MNSFAPRSMARLQGLVPCPGRPIFFLGEAKRIIDGDTVFIILLCRELLIVQRFFRVDALVTCILEDGAERVTGVCTIKRDL